MHTCFRQYEVLVQYHHRQPGAVGDILTAVLVALLGCRYWYENGVLYPDLGTVWIAVDKTDRNNGCVQVPGRQYCSRAA